MGNDDLLAPPELSRSDSAVGFAGLALAPAVQAAEPLPEGSH